MSEQMNTTGEGKVHVPTKEEREEIIRRFFEWHEFHEVSMTARDFALRLIAALEHLEAERDALRAKFDKLQSDDPLVSIAALMDSVSDNCTGHQAGLIEDLICYHIRRADTLREENARLKAEIRDLNEELHPRSKDAWPGSQGSYNQRSPEEDQI